MVMGKKKTGDEDDDDDAGGIKGTCMQTCDIRMVDEPCTINGFLENQQIQ